MRASGERGAATLTDARPDPPHEPPPPPPVPAPPSPRLAPPRGADAWTAAAVEDLDPADDDILQSLWRRVRTSVLFAIAAASVAGWAAILLVGALGLTTSLLGPVVARMLLGAALLFVALDRLRRPPVFGGIPRAWDDPAWVYGATVRGRHGRRFLRNGRPGAVHADPARLRILWGRKYLLDRLVVATVALAPVLLSWDALFGSAIYVFLLAYLLGLPRLRRSSVDLLPEEISEIVLRGQELVVVTTREGDDSRFDLKLTTFDQAGVADHLRHAFGDAVRVEVAP